MIYQIKINNLEELINIYNKLKLNGFISIDELDNEIDFFKKCKKEKTNNKFSFEIDIKDKTFVGNYYYNTITNLNEITEFKFINSDETD